MAISDELRRKGVAAATIREALGGWREQEMLRLIAALAKSPSTLEALVTVQADAKSFYRLTKELELSMAHGIDDEDTKGES